MNKISHRIVLLVVLILLCTAFIFSNSLKNGEESRADSDVIMEIVERIAEVIFPNNTLDWNYIVRKGAHLFEFCVLGILVTLLAFLCKHRTAVVYALLYVAFVASTDEFIQQFTGRSSRLADVGIDITGALIGFGLVWAVRWAIKRRQSKKIDFQENEYAVGE
ncbi:MAG: VanZ family protein [Clostridia bacterium]|nr:VanZ family protein [Clostridia bacterium]